jgi:hypothetical protein
MRVGRTGLHDWLLAAPSGHRPAADQIEQRQQEGRAHRRVHQAADVEVAVVEGAEREGLPDPESNPALRLGCRGRTVVQQGVTQAQCPLLPLRSAVSRCRRSVGCEVRDRHCNDPADVGGLLTAVGAGAQLRKCIEIVSLGCNPMDLASADWLSTVRPQELLPQHHEVRGAVAPDGFSSFCRNLPSCVDGERRGRQGAPVPPRCCAKKDTIRSA